MPPLPNLPAWIRPAPASPHQPGYFLTPQARAWFAPDAAQKRIWALMAAAPRASPQAPADVRAARSRPAPAWPSIPAAPSPAAPARRSATDRSAPARARRSRPAGTGEKSAPGGAAELALWWRLMQTWVKNSRRRTGTHKKKRPSVAFSILAERVSVEQHSGECPIFLLCHSVSVHVCLRISLAIHHFLN